MISKDFLDIPASNNKLIRVTSNMPAKFYNINLYNLGFSDQKRQSSFLELKKIAVNKNIYHLDRIQAIKYMIKIPHHDAIKHSIEAAKNIIDDYVYTRDLFNIDPFLTRECYVYCFQNNKYILSSSIYIYINLYNDNLWEDARKILLSIANGKETVCRIEAINTLLRNINNEDYNFAVNLLKHYEPCNDKRFNPEILETIRKMFIEKQLSQEENKYKLTLKENILLNIITFPGKIEGFTLFELFTFVYNKLIYKFGKEEADKLVKINNELEIIDLIKLFNEKIPEQLKDVIFNKLGKLLQNLSGRDQDLILNELATDGDKSGVEEFIDMYGFEDEIVKEYSNMGKETVQKIYRETVNSWMGK
jgi:hypothetical protein